MKNLYLILFMLLALNNVKADKYKLPVNIQPYNIIDEASFNKEFVTKTIKKVAEYQLNKYGDSIPIKDWLVGTFFSSFAQAYEVTGDRWYYEKGMKWGRLSNWDINKPLNADDVCPTQVYTDFFFLNKDKNLIETVDKKLSKAYFNRTKTNPGEIHTWDKEGKEFIGRNIWSWVDALYMTMPAFSRMGKATNNELYFQTLDKFFFDVKDFLYDPQENLFFRNSKKQTEMLRTPNDKKIFWSRGNGWAFAALARSIEYIPDSDTLKVEYIDTFKKLAYSIIKYQGEDGLWRSSINDPKWYPTKETSGSSFFVFGITKGINEGWLPKEYFLPFAIKGWTGLLNCVEPNGRLGYAQIVAGTPNEVRPNDNVDYTSGAFILSGTEIIKLNAEKEISSHVETIFRTKFVAKDIKKLNKVIFNKGTFFVPYIKDNLDLALTTFTTDLWPNASNYARKEIVLGNIVGVKNYKSIFNPILSPSSNNSLYILSKKENVNSQILLETPTWKSAFINKEYSEKPEIKKTIALYKLKKSNTLYKIYIGTKNEVALSSSKNDGHTWNNSKVLFKDTLVKCFSNLEDRIDFFVKDKKQNIHSFYLLDKDNILKENKGSLVCKKDITICDIKYYKNNPILLYKNNKTYYECSLPNNKVKNIYTVHSGEIENITMDPTNPNVFVLSSNCNPSNGEILPNNLSQLFKMDCSKDITLYKQLTFDPLNNQTNPQIIKGKYNSLFWKCNNDIYMSDKY